MFGSVRLPRLLTLVAAGALFCGLLGFVGQPGAGWVRAQTVPSSDDSPAAARQKTEATLETLKQQARADEQAASAKISSQALPLATELDSQTHEMREHLKKMRRLAIQYHLSEQPAETKRLRSEWIKMLATGRTLHQRMVEAAMAEYRAKPDPKSQTAEFLYQVAARNADADRFDGMLEVVKLLKETGYTAPNFDLCFGLTSVAHNEFEEARPNLEVAIKNLESAGEKLAKSAEVNDEQRQKTLTKMSETHALLSDLSNAEYYRPLWEKEQKMRQGDAEGKPLPRVLIETTKGSFEVELYEDQAPNTVANFISLCEQNFYDGLPFHRVLTHFMAQAGCPNRDGSGGPGYTIRTELSEDHRYFFRGTLGLALSAQPDSGGSQFFVCYVPRAYLNDKYVAFGRVIEGMNVLSDLVHIDPEEKSEGEHAHDEPDEIISTKVVRKRDHPYVPEKMPAAK